MPATGDPGRGVNAGCSFLRATPVVPAVKTPVLDRHRPDQATAAARNRTDCVSLERPIALLIGGAPGAGKTTLAGVLGQRLRLPVLSKDVLRQSTLWSLGTADVKEAPWGPGLWYPALEALLRAGVSVIGDMTLYRGVSEDDIQDRLAPIARLMHVHCRARNAEERFRTRTLADSLRQGDLDELDAIVAPLFSELWEPIDLQCPCVVVNTDNGYDPSIDDLVAQVVDRLGPHLGMLR